KTKSPATTKGPATTSPAPEDPAPAESPAAPETAAGSFYETSADLRFPGNKISGQALKDRLEASVEKALTFKYNVGVSRKDPLTGKVWDTKDTTAYEDWTVTLPLPEKQAQAVLDQLKLSLEKTPVWQSSNAIMGQVTVDTQL